MTDVPVAEGVLDTLGMFEVTAGLPEQVAAAVDAARGLDGLPEREYVENVVVLGMGGSGLAGDVMVAVAGPFVPVPITVVKSYNRSDFVGRLRGCRRCRCVRRGASLGPTSSRNDAGATVVLRFATVRACKRVT